MYMFVCACVLTFLLLKNPHKHGGYVTRHSFRVATDVNTTDVTAQQHVEHLLGSKHRRTVASDRTCALTSMAAAYVSGVGEERVLDACVGVSDVTGEADGEAREDAR